MARPASAEHAAGDGAVHVAHGAEHELVGGVGGQRRARRAARRGTAADRRCGGAVTASVSVAYPEYVNDPCHRR